MLSHLPFPSIGRLVLIVGCLLLVLLLALFLLPVYLDITAFVSPVERLLSDIIETPVTVDEVEIDLGLFARLRLRGFMIHAPDESSPPFVRMLSNAVYWSLDLAPPGEAAVSQP